MDKLVKEKIDAIYNLNIAYTKIVSVSYENSGECEEYSDLPCFYRVVLQSSYAKGSLINTEVWLPRDWNGIFVGLGNGGMAGKVNYGSLANHIRRGYACANTDMGTSGGRERGSMNPEVWKDFGWRSTHGMTVASKEIILNHYGRKQDYSYFVGASTGGQQAFSLVQRFPRDYDGVVAGVPANNRVFLHTYFLWNHKHLRKQDKTVMFSDCEIEKIYEFAVNFFKEHGDGQKDDNYIDYPYYGRETVNDFIEYLQTKDCFTAEQLDALKKVYNGPQNPVTGKQIYNGMPIGSERFGCGIKECQGDESPHFYPFIWAFGEDYDGLDFDFNNDLEKVSNMLSGDLNANDPDLSEFENNGGKLIAFSGSCDPCVPFPDAMNYYQRACENMGGFNTVSKFFKYFLMPGKDHGTGGFGTKFVGLDENYEFDLLEAVRLWREKGQELQFVYGIRKTEGNGFEFARKVYPFNPENELIPIVCDNDYLNRGK